MLELAKIWPFARLGPTGESNFSISYKRLGVFAKLATTYVGDKGVIRRKQYEAQTNQAMCLNVVTNAVIIWNTVYMQAALDQLRAEGYPVQEEDLATFHRV